MNIALMKHSWIRGEGDTDLFSVPVQVPDTFVSGSGIFGEEGVEQIELVRQWILKQPFDFEVKAWNGFCMERACGEGIDRVIVLTAAQNEKAAFGHVQKDDFGNSDVAIVCFQRMNVGGPVIERDDFDHKVGCSVNSLVLYDLLPANHRTAIALHCHCTRL